LWLRPTSALLPMPRSPSQWSWRNATALRWTSPVSAADRGRLQQEVESKARVRLRESVNRTCANADATCVVLTSRTPALAVLSYARDAHVDLIVGGTHGRRGVSRMLLGSVANTLVQRAECPVLIVRAAARPAEGEQPVREFGRARRG
jgi:nucleotide-binding universal stress UspA family protein